MRLYRVKGILTGTQTRPPYRCNMLKKFEILKSMAQKCLRLTFKKLRSGPGYRHRHVVIHNNLFNRSKINTV